MNRLLKEALEVMVGSVTKKSGNSENVAMFQSTISLKRKDVNETGNLI